MAAKTSNRGRPVKAGKRWTLIEAGAEFGIHRDTLSRRLRHQGIEPENKRYTTQQIVSAIHGDLAGEKLAKIRTERELLEIELAQERSELIPAEAVFKAWENIAVAIRQIIKGSELSDTEKNEVLKNIREIPLSEIVH